MVQSKVKAFFDRPDYLKNSSDRIAIRSILVSKFLGAQSDVSILDIGCGDGSLSLPLLNEKNQLTLVDISGNMIHEVSKRIPPHLTNHVRLINDTFESVSDDLRFDIVLCVGVLAHVPDVASLLQKIATVLKPGGLLVIETTPNPYPIGKVLYPYYYLRQLLSGTKLEYTKNRITVDNLIQDAKSIGLNFLESVRYSFPLPGMSHWSHELKMRYTFFTLENRLMSKLGTEYIMLFQRKIS